MHKFEIRPYRLINKIQNYSWGTKNEYAFIPKLLGIPIEKDKPYAELWMGTHPNAPSEVEINGQKIFLNEFIKKYPKEILGEQVLKNFGKQLPFLFKVLSAGEALSIQAHPNKEQAKYLHQKDPFHYPDSNHKPEIAIAIDYLDALVGFRPLKEINQILKIFPEITYMADIKNEIKTRNHFKYFFKNIMLSSENSPLKLEKTLKEMQKTILSKRTLDERDHYFLDLYAKYGNDIGLISIYLLNLVHLKSQQAVFLKAGVPHAYLKGNIIECMANSDNVVRAGLTPKFKDVPTLLEILTYELGQVRIINTNSVSNFIYRLPIQEFAVQYCSLKKNQNFTLDVKTITILLSLEGEIKLACQGKETIISKGESFLLPARLKKCKITALQSYQGFCAYVPIF